jgi:hypothetical protein
MAATGRELTRRAFLSVFTAALLRAADQADEVWEVITAMATALGRGDDVGFLSACDRSLPGYATLRTNVAALIAAAEIESAIDPVRNTGDAAVREVEVDWQLNLVDRGGLQRVTRRRQVMKCKLEKRGRNWKVVLLDPVSFFAAPSAGLDLAHERRAAVALR